MRKLDKRDPLEPILATRKSSSNPFHIQPTSVDDNTKSKLKTILSDNINKLSNHHPHSDHYSLTKAFSTNQKFLKNKSGYTFVCKMIKTCCINKSHLDGWKRIFVDKPFILQGRGICTTTKFSNWRVF